MDGFPSRTRLASRDIDASGAVGIEPEARAAFGDLVTGLWVHGDVLARCQLAERVLYCLMPARRLAVS
jgi:hypothetical protein